jgi:hypothetical protein
MFDGNTNLASGNSYNCPNADGFGATTAQYNPLPATADFQCSFNEITAAANDILFVTGDGTIWATTSYENSKPSYSQAPNTPFQRCISGTQESITGNILLRPNFEDPWIGIANGRHLDSHNQELMIWGENNHRALKQNHGGVNVYVRPTPA